MGKNWSHVDDIINPCSTLRHERCRNLLFLASLRSVLILGVKPPDFDDVTMGGARPDNEQVKSLLEQLCKPVQEVQKIIHDPPRT